MKRKVRVKSLPKAQFAGQRPSVILTPEQQAIWQKNQGMFGADYILDTPKVFQNPPSVKLGEPKVFDNFNQQFDVVSRACDVMSSPEVNPFHLRDKLTEFFLKGCHGAL